MKDRSAQMYKSHREQLIEILQELQRIVPKDKLRAKLPAICLDLEEEKFRLVVLGQFKRGKSTFLNALLGANILPTDVIPVTAVITEIHYGVTPGGQNPFS